MSFLRNIKDFAARKAVRDYDTRGDLNARDRSLSGGDIVDAFAGQAFQPARLKGCPTAGCKACPTRLNASTRALFILLEKSVIARRKNQTLRVNKVATKQPELHESGMN